MESRGIDGYHSKRSAIRCARLHPGHSPETRILSDQLSQLLRISLLDGGQHDRPQHSAVSLKEKKEGEQGNKEPADTTDSPGSDHNTKSRDRREAYVTLARPGTSRDRRAKNENAAFNDHFYYQHDPPPVAHGVNWVSLAMVGGVTATSSQPFIFNCIRSHPQKCPCKLLRLSSHATVPHKELAAPQYTQRA